MGGTKIRVGPFWPSSTYIMVYVDSEVEKCEEFKNGLKIIYKGYFYIILASNQPKIPLETYLVYHITIYINSFVGTQNETKIVNQNHFKANNYIMSCPTLFYLTKLESTIKR